jgi:hypothetical protein
MVVVKVMVSEWATAKPIETAVAAVGLALVV